MEQFLQHACPVAKATCSPAACAVCEPHPEAQTTQPNAQVFFEYNGIPRVVEVREESKAAAATKKVRLLLSPLPLLLGSWSGGFQQPAGGGVGGADCSSGRHQKGACSHLPGGRASLAARCKADSTSTLPPWAPDILPNLTCACSHLPLLRPVITLTCCLLPPPSPQAAGDKADSSDPRSVGT